MEDQEHQSQSKKRLINFSDDSDSESYDSNDKQTNQFSIPSGNDRLQINANYAVEYEKRKQREELVNSRQKSNRFSADSGENESQFSDSSSDESEDEEAELLTPHVDLQILKTINAIRKKDESIYNPDNKFFEHDNDTNTEDDSDNNNTTKKLKVKKYKDVVREAILHKMSNNSNDESDKSDSEQDTNRNRRNDDRNTKLAYDEEQVALRDAFLTNDKDSNDSGDSDDDFILQRKRKDDDKDSETDMMLDEEIAKLSSEKDNTQSDLVDPRGEISNGEQFLLDFIKNKRWIDHDEYVNHNHDSEEEGADHNSDASLKDLDDTDAFESKYNFRFEEEANQQGPLSGALHSSVGYARSSLSDTIRRKDDSRKLKRQQRKERKMEERRAKEEQLKRLKNAKREELEERLKQIKGVLGDETLMNSDQRIDEGDVDEELVLKLLEGDYDPDKFEDMMSKIYTEDYYNKEDKQWKTDLDVKESLRQDLDGYEEQAPDGDLYDNVEDEDLGSDEDNWRGQEAYSYDEEETEKPESTLEKKLKSKMLDELYKLDYEDIIGDMPTRFKYRKVQANRYGLTPEEILFSGDSHLKQFVSLKKMAPYDERGEFVPGAKKRKRFREVASLEIENARLEWEKEHGLKNARTEKLNDDDDDDNVTSKKKRRRQKKGKKKSKSEASDIICNDQDDNKDVSINNPPNHESEAGKKGGRKKKGKKGSLKNADTFVGDEKEKYSSITQTSNDVCPAPEKKKKKKKSKEKKTAVEGISSSRLASYGL